MTQSSKVAIDSRCLRRWLHLARVPVVRRPLLSGPGAGAAFCAALGVLGSARRSVGELHVAASVLYIALPFSYRAGLRAEARMLQRVAYVLRDHRRYADAIMVASRAGALFGESGDLEGFAETLVDRGLLHYATGEHQTAATVLRIALKGLSKSQRRNRFAALHALGVICHDDKAGSSQSSDYLAEAESLLDSEAGFEYASLLFTKAGLSRSDGDLQRAVELVQQARLLLCHPVDVAATTLELMDLLLEQGRDAEALRERQSLGSLIEALRAHPRAELALISLCRIDVRALTRDLVVTTKATLREERGRR